MNLAPLITLGIELAGKVIDYVNKVREVARQNQEMTPEQDADFEKQIDEVTSRAHWKPEAPPIVTPDSGS